MSSKTKKNKAAAEEPSPRKTKNKKNSHNIA